MIKDLIVPRSALALLLSLPWTYCFSSCLSLTPIQTAPSVIYPNQTATASYEVTNTTSFTLSNNGIVQFPAGLSQLVESGTCTNPFTLSPGQSCTLLLQITANQMQGNLVGCPIVCNTHALPTYCSQPVAGDQLNVTLGTTGNTTLSLSTANVVVPINNSTGMTITVYNTTNIPAVNVHADLTATGWTDVQATTCSLIPGNSSCTITFTSTTNTAHLAQGNIPITGDNVSSPPTLAIAFSIYGGLVFDIHGTNIVSIVQESDAPQQYAWGLDGVAIGTDAQSLTDGLQNSNAIVSYYGPSASYAANYCENLSIPVGSDPWYLPAICEWSSNSSLSGCNIGNIVDNLQTLGFGNFSGTYWSSTEEAAEAEYSAFTQLISPNSQSDGPKGGLLNVRCVFQIPTY